LSSFTRIVPQVVSARLNRNPLYVVEADVLGAAIVDRVVRVSAWLAISRAFSSVPPFLR
jgi:hypothetical protein